MTGAGTWNFIVAQATPVASYVHVTNSNATGSAAQINATTGSYDNGGNTYWDFGAPAVTVTVSGTIYTAENKSTNIGPNKTIALSINGTAATTVETTDGGVFTFSSQTVSTNQTVAIFISGETEKGSLITQAADNSTNITGLELYTGHIVLTHNTAGPMTNTLLATVDNVANSDLLISVDGSNVATFTSGDTVWILAGKTYTPGANVSLGSLNILSTGSFTPEGNTTTINDSGTPFMVGGTFNEGTSTVVYAGASPTNVTGSTYKNLTINHAAVTFTQAGSATVSGVFTIQAGIFDASSQLLYLSGTTGTPFVNSGTFTSSTSTVYYTGNNGGGNTNVTATTYNNLYLNNGSETYAAAGNIGVGGVLTINAGTFSAADKAITLSGSGTPFVITGTFLEGTSTIEYTGGSATNVTASTYSNLKLNHTGTTFSATGSTTVSGVFTIQAGVFDGSDKTIILSGNGTPFVVSGTFAPSTSTVRYTGDSSTTVAAVNYWNLETKTASATSVGKGIDLAGSTSKVGASTNSALNISTNLTIELWLQLDSDNQHAGLIFKGSSATQGEYSLLLYNNYVYFRLNGSVSGPGELISTSTLTGTGLHHLAATYDGSYQRIWLDGTKIGEAAYSTAITNTNVGMWVGSYFDGNYGLNGKIYSTRISNTVRYSTAFSPIKGWFDDQNTSLLWNYEEGTGTNINDDSSNNIDGTVIGSYSWANQPDSGVLTPVYTISGGTLDVGGSYTNGDGTNEILVQASTNDPTFNVNGNFANAAKATFIASDSASLSVASDFSLNASSTFTHSSGGITLDGQGLQTVTMNGTVAGHNFNNLTITNADSTNGIVFADSITIIGTFTDVTATSKITFHSGSTYAFNAINIDGQSTGTRITLTSSTGGSAWNLNIAASSPTASNVWVKDSNANKDVDATTGGYDGTGNTHWLFPAGNSVPTNDSLAFTNPYSSNVVVADDTTEWNFRALVTDSNGSTDLSYVELRLANATDSTQPYDSLKFRWTEATDTFSEEADTQNAATLTSTSANSTANGNQWTLDFKVKINSSFTSTSTNYAAELYSLDDAAAADTDNYSNIYQVNGLSLSASVNNASIAFGQLLPGSVLTGTTDITVTTNYPNGYSISASDSVTGSNSALLNTDNTTRVSDYTGTIATPTIWSSGTGFGICLYVATGKNTSKWGTGTTETDVNNKYAGVPETATQIHQKTGSPTSSDLTEVGYKLVVPNTQKTGDYAGVITYTVTGALN